MKIIYVELFFHNSVLEHIKLNIIRKYKNSYYYDCVFKVNYQNEFLQDILSNLIQKANLEKNDLLINYIYDNISFIKLSLPKMANMELYKNVDTELNNLVSNYKEKYALTIDKIISQKTNLFRAILYPKKESLLELDKNSLKEQKITKYKEINHYQIIETIMRSYKYKSNITYSIVTFYENSIHVYILRNSYVIELFIIDIKKELIEQYNLSYKYDEIINVNNQYFKSICIFLNQFFENRNVEGAILIFDDLYNEYLRKLIDQDIVINHVINNFEVILKAIEVVFYEK